MHKYLYCIGSAHISAVASLIIEYKGRYFCSLSVSSFHIMLEWYPAYAILYLGKNIIIIITVLQWAHQINM